MVLMRASTAASMGLKPLAKIISHATHAQEPNWFATAPLGACALGHPIGAIGARIMVTLLYALQARGLKKGVATLCIGGGEATAVALQLL